MATKPGRQPQAARRDGRHRRGRHQAARLASEALRRGHFPDKEHGNRSPRCAGLADQLEAVTCRPEDRPHAACGRRPRPGGRPRSRRPARSGSTSDGHGRGPPRHALLRLHHARLPRLALGVSVARAPRGRRRSPSARPTWCRARARCSRPTGCPTPSGSPPATSAPVTSPRSVADDPLLDARLRGHRRRGRRPDGVLRARPRPAAGAVGRGPRGRRPALVRRRVRPDAPRWPSRPRPPCSTCGYFVPMAGALRAVFGVCANEWSPSDARVVSLDHGCGAHTETDVDLRRRGGASAADPRRLRARHPDLTARSTSGTRAAEQTCLSCSP